MSVFSSAHPTLDEPVWDAELGVWVGDKAPSLHLDDLKSPLYILGYGSLIWRPGTMLEVCPTFPITAIGCRRVFAQRSYDHRGNSKFPGVVLNLVSDETLRISGYMIESAEKESLIGEECYGLVWLIPDEKIKEIIEDLDFREKGGYSRHYIDVKLQADSPHYPTGSIIKALVYTGLEENPNFYLPKLLHRGQFLHDFTFRSAVVDLITAAKGPSGTNIEYLLRLQRFLETQHMSDIYLNNLAAAVRMRMGSWRRQHYLDLVAQAIPTPIESDKSQSKTIQEHPLVIMGCGSNEFRQLSNSDNEIQATFVDIASVIELFFTDIIPSPLLYSWNSMEEHQVLAGGGSSGYLYKNRLVLWGSLVSKVIANLTTTTTHHAIAIDNVEHAVLGYDYLAIVLKSSGYLVLLGGVPIRVMEDIQNCPSYLPNTAFTLISTVTSSGRLILSFTVESRVVNEVKVLKVAIGPRHMAVITTTDNNLHILGSKQPYTTTWSPPYTYDGSVASLVDVACGARHTAVIDDQGRIFTFGQANQFNSLGHTTDSENNEVLASLAKAGVKWLKISAGWYHTVVGGVNKDGELVTYAWGRCDMGQIGPQPPDTVTVPSQPLVPLPEGRSIATATCGSDYTYAIDAESGSLWVTGWNEHGNLGLGHCDHMVKDGWRRVEGMTVVLWDGSLACGGAHVLCIPQPPAASLQD